jgi:hypothetical protein
LRRDKAKALVIFFAARARPPPWRRSGKRFALFALRAQLILIYSRENSSAASRQSAAGTGHSIRAKAQPSQGQGRPAHGDKSRRLVGCCVVIRLHGDGTANAFLKCAGLPWTPMNVTTGSVSNCLGDSMACADQAASGGPLCR